MKDIHQPWKVRIDGVDHFYWIGESLNGPIDALYLLCNDQSFNHYIDNISFIYHDKVEIKPDQGGVMEDDIDLYPPITKVNLCPDCFRVELMQRLSE